MKRFLVAILVTMTLVLSMGSCHEGNSVVGGQTIAFDTLAVDSVCPLFRNYDKPACHVSIRVEVPSATVETDLSRSLQRVLVTLPRDGALVEDSEGSMEGLLRAYVRQYIFQYLQDGKEAIDSYNGDMEAASTWMNYEEVVEGKVLYNAEDLLCYQFVTYSYAGGAHGNTTAKNCVFDCDRRSPVTLSQLFALESMPQVDELIRAELMRQNECSTLEALEDCSFFSPGEITATENFTVSDKGICWMFDPYEIAPYSMGSIDVLLSWHKLLPLMLEDAPLAAFASRHASANE